MPFEFKGQQNFNQKQAYEMMKSFNKSLRDNKISDESQVNKEVPRTVTKQSGFCK